MAALLLRGSKNKLLSVRTICVGLEEEAYLLTDYMAELATDYLSPRGLMHHFVTALTEIETGHSKINPERDKRHLKELTQRKDVIKKQSVYITRIIDAIAEPEFALIFRQLYNEYVGIEM